MIRRSLVAVALVALLGCEAELSTTPPVTPPPRPSPTAPTAPPAPVDPLATKPALAAPKRFDPPTPQVFKLPSGTTVWLVERRSLPLVSLSLAIPVGASADPVDLPGLAYLTADMLDEGAGTRSAVEVSSAINDLGAQLSTGARPDGSQVSLTVLKKNFDAAFSIFADVVARPRFEPKEYRRVRTLWENDLTKRADDPARVARVVTSAVLYGPGTPYGHPAEGLLRGARKVDLAAVKGFYAETWRPDVALLVVVGDITRAEIEKAATTHLASWKAPATPAKPVAAPPPPRSARPRLVLVDRKDAPQSVVGVIREGVAATDPQAPQLDLVNTAIGGSFTSRLNQNLREDHGWSYGAHSSFSETRGVGAFAAGAAVHTEATGPALKEMLRELTKVAAEGLTAEELRKVLAQDRGELVQTYETTGGVAGRLATLATLGLPPGFDAAASASRQQATLPRLAELARAHVDPKTATVLVVGPRDKVAPQLAELGLGEPEIYDAEGTPLTKPDPKATDKPKSDAPKPKTDATKGDAPKPIVVPPKKKK